MPSCVICQRGKGEWRHTNFVLESEAKTRIEDEEATSASLAEQVEVHQEAEEELRAQIEDLQTTLQNERVEALETIRALEAETPQTAAIPGPAAS